MPAGRKSIPPHLLATIQMEQSQFQTFQRSNPFPPDGEFMAWLAQELDLETASMNMLGEPWLESYGLGKCGVDRLQLDCLRALYAVGLQPLDVERVSQVRGIGKFLHGYGGFRAMKCQFVILQGTINSSYIFGEGTREPGVLSFCPFISKCWDGIGVWTH